jgi:hypothetical protein
MEKNIDIIRIDSSNRGSLLNICYLAEYYKLRSKVFKEEYNADLYEKPTDYDMMKSTIFFLARDKEKNKIIAGSELIFSRRGDKDNKGRRPRLKLEHKEEFFIENLLPHIDRSKINYAELAGVVADKEYATLRTALELQKQAFASEDVKKLDVILGGVTEKNTNIVLRAMKGLLEPVIRNDIGKKSIDNKFPIVVMLASPNGKINMLPKNMKLKPVNRRAHFSSLPHVRTVEAERSSRGGFRR